MYDPRAFPRVARAALTSKKRVRDAGQQASKHTSGSRSVAEDLTRKGTTPYTIHLLGFCVVELLSDVSQLQNGRGYYVERSQSHCCTFSLSDSPSSTTEATSPCGRDYDSGSAARAEFTLLLSLSSQMDIEDREIKNNIQTVPNKTSC